MLNLWLLLAQIAAQAPNRPAEIRSLSVSITDGRDEPISELATLEVAVVENGVVREITKIQRDARPVNLAVLVDTSEAVQTSYRLNIVDAVLSFLAGLPEGSRYELWTTGDRPTRVLDLGANAQEARKALQRVAPQGGTTLLDAIVEAGEHLKKTEGERRAMVVVSAFGPEFSGRDRFQVIARALDFGLDVFSAVLIEEGTGADGEMRLNYEHVLDELTSKTGGLLERPLSALATATALRRVGRYLQARFRISYATLPEIKQRKIEVKVARPGVRVRVGRSTTDTP
jgi:Mg-chelatase subunit ChlD